MEPIKSRVLVVGCTGYIGRLMAQASLDLNHPTYLLVRPDVVHDITRVEIVLGFKAQGAKLLEGSLDDNDSLLAALKQVDVVVSAMAENRLLSQLKLVEAIKQAGNIKRFLPSEFGMDPDRMHHALKPGNHVFESKREVRRAVEAAGIPHTFVSANCFAGYFLSSLAQFAQFMPPKEKAFIYGDGTAKVVWVVEADVGRYALSTVDDPRAVNKTIYIRPPANVLSQKEVVEMWEEMSGVTLVKCHIPEEDFLRDLQGPPSPKNEALSIFYHVFYKGECSNFDISDDVSASHLYPHIDYMSASSYLKRFL
ncbi:hypothetical protein SELMODRAFT_438560 [Selaginella moellendorffii]|uniref:NmrA-like domain-containing protein n=1 Tax=Selaginella moellendorffii TaxID=88036 RepID=D8QWR3_SELML|nr:bifunctional pinoresinol-lariciresinol reductase [Selaginella moellendorffii]EFJ35680.1 hypothetical protein SELMODRAFT_438560 [Selaginella moellendorffii]|eukprot:XP_002963809.1 bifunctional pinoresinol-lariciresinol reductase [Selaginella moellendorffii]